MRKLRTCLRAALFTVIALLAVFVIPGREVQAASTYYSVVNDCEGGRVFAEKAGDYYIWADNTSTYGMLKIGTKAGVAKITKKYKGKEVSDGIITNGSTIYYAAGDNLYKISVKGTGYKKVATIKNLADVCGVYGGKIYFTKTIYASNGMYKDERLYSYTLSTGKTSGALVKQFRFQSSYGAEISGRQFTMAADVQPIKIYSMKTGQCTTPVKATLTCIYGSKLYYFAIKEGVETGDLKCYNLVTGKKTAVVRNLPFRAIGRKSAMFIDYTSTGKTVYTKYYYSSKKYVNF